MLFCKFHHALADGHAIFNALINCCDNPAILVQPKISSRRNWTEKLAEGFKVLKSSVPVVEEFLWGPPVDTEKSNPWDFPPASMSSSRHSTLSTDIPLDKVKAVSGRLDVAMVSILIAAVTGAVRKYLVKTGQNFSSKIGSTFPLHVPNHPKGLTNSL